MRIGIDIPDELMRRLEPLKSQLNVSQLCREAIEARVAQFERNVVVLDNSESTSAIRAAVEQEMAWLKIVDVDWGQYGYEDAIDWVKAAGLKDWDQWRRSLEVGRRHNRPAWQTQIPLSGNRRHVAKLFHDRLTEYMDVIGCQSDEFSEWRYEHGLYVDVRLAEREYHRAWSAYVAAAWDKKQRVKNELEEELRLDRRQRLARLWDPDLLKDLRSGTD